MSINKNGQLDTSLLIENGYGLQNIQFTNGESTVTYNNGIYTVVSKVTSSNWGSTFSILRNSVIVPYNASYRIELEVNISTAHNIVIDINNAPCTVATWSGNDNDLTTSRTGTVTSIPANTWTKIMWGSTNAHASNTTQDLLAVYDGIGLYTANDSSSITWQFRNPKAKIYFNEKTLASIGQNYINSNNFYEY